MKIVSKLLLSVYVPQQIYHYDSICRCPILPICADLYSSWVLQWKLHPSCSGAHRSRQCPILPICADLYSRRLLLWKLCPSHSGVLYVPQQIHQTDSNHPCPILPICADLYLSWVLQWKLCPSRFGVCMFPSRFIRQTQITLAQFCRFVLICILKSGVAVESAPELLWSASE